MALENVPWAVTGAEVTAAVARQELFDSMSGAEGVSSVGSMKVQALQTPGPKVRIAPGGATLNNRYAGGSGQSYSARNRTETEIPVTATGSAGGRTDLVVLRILDPEFEGQAPEDPDEFSYTRISVIEGVSSNTKSVKDLNLTYPAIALARISIPASTATITNAMITDLREVARPRRDQVLRTFALTGDQGSTLGRIGSGDGDNGQTWPVEIEAAWGGIPIPEWATRMKIVMTWTGIGTPTGNTNGWLWVQVGATVHPDHVITQGVKYDMAKSPSWSRTMHMVADERHIPASMRGTKQTFYPRGNIVSGVERLSLDAASAIVLQVEFMEQAD